MAIINNEKINYSNKSSIIQSVWNYMRRNRNFRIGDLLMICGIKHSYLQRYVRFLELAEYVKRTSGSKPYSNREYLLLKNTGPFAPSMNQYGLYDFNKKEAIQIINNEKKRKQFAPEVIIKVLKSIDYDETTKDNLILKANIPARSLIKWWDRLQKFGVILSPIPVNNSHKKRWPSDKVAKFKRDGAKLIYKVDKKRSQFILEELKSGIYSPKTPEMRELWIKQ
jgi:predicted transcriptional regulator